jgi:hypothetical protein
MSNSAAERGGRILTSEKLAKKTMTVMAAGREDMRPNRIMSSPWMVIKMYSVQRRPRIP